MIFILQNKYKIKYYIYKYLSIIPKERKSLALSRIIKLENDIKLHLINTEKYKTNVIAVFLTHELSRDDVTKEALIPAVLRMGTQNNTTQQELNKEFERLYGANFNCGIEKRGDNHIVKFYTEVINDEYAIEKEELLIRSINLLFDIILNPITENDGFKEEYVNGEKENLKRIIEAKIDNKSLYAYLRCLEEMFKGKEYSLYEYGYVEDLENIDSKNLYEFYKRFLSECKFDIFISGNLKDEEKIKKTINEILAKYFKNNERKKAYYSADSKEKYIAKQEKCIEEKMDVTQGKLAMSLSINNDGKNIAASSVYNSILGGGANSKLFQNVREKASLAYTAGSGYIKTKNVIVVRCGIEIKNYKKAVEIIKKQLDDMKNGKFTPKDIINAKELLVGGLSAIKDEQTSEISYELSRELGNDKSTIDEYIEQIKNVKKQDIIDIAKEISINTIYFLKG